MTEYIIPGANLVVLIGIYFKLNVLDRRLEELEGVYKESARRDSLEQRTCGHHPA